MSQDSTLVYESKVKIQWLSVSHQTFMQRDKEQMAQVIAEGTSWQGHQCCFSTLKVEKTPDATPLGITRYLNSHDREQLQR